MPTSIDVFAKVRGHEREELLRAAHEADLMPYFRTVESPAMPVVEMEGKPRIMLASNNYLGLTGDERVMKGAEDALHRYGTGLTGSRLLNGTTPLHLELERELAEWMDTEDAIVFTTGHQANVGTLGTLLGPADTVIVDSADHASILDGALISKAKMRPFRHHRLDKLERALARAEGDGGGVLVVVDGVFSMEGDVAPLVDICELCERHGARLMVDEAHGAGVLGARGAGTAELLGVEAAIEKMTIRAPIAGTVLAINAKTGELAAPSMDLPLVLLGDISALRVRAELDERDLGEIKVGHAALVRAPAFRDREFAGKVAAIAPIVQASRISSREQRNLTDVSVAEVMVDLTDAGPLAVGMKVDVFFRLDTPK